jgi:HprK-related kinase B
MHTLRLDVGGCRIDIVTDAAGLARKLQRYFREVETSRASHADFRIVAVEAAPLEIDDPLQVKVPDFGKARVKEEWVDLAGGRVVRKRLTGMVFVFGSGLHLAYGPCTEHDNQVVNFVNNRYMQWRLAQGYLLAHAGGVARHGRCLALCGPSGAGKSTAALGLLGAGLDFVSNDRLLFRRLDGAIEVQGIPKHPRVNPGTILFNERLRDTVDAPERARLLRLPPEQLRALEDKHDILIDEAFGPGRFRMQALLEALVVFNWSGAGVPDASPADLAERTELLPLITKSPGLFYEADAGDEPLDLGDHRYVEALAGCRIIEITGRQDFEAARRLCLEVLDAAPAPLG